MTARRQQTLLSLLCMSGCPRLLVFIWRCWKWFIMWAVALSCWKEAYVLSWSGRCSKNGVTICVTYWFKFMISKEMAH
jgi:hypothetical protein